MKEVSVVYQDGMMDMVEPEVLQSLIQNEDIVKFQRADGWAYPGIDQVRRMIRSGYQGSERRML
jgi:hypothetical protein